MVQVTPFLLVLSLALVAPVFSTESCVLTGKWADDLGSIMTIPPVDEQGKFDGSYITAGKNAPGKVHISPLVGYQHKTNTWSQPTFGFTVNWNLTDLPANSITVFTGQCFLEDGGKETLKTMWLQWSGVDNNMDDWKATIVGTSTFTRQDQQEQGGIV